jgi:hypothetical protein
MQRADFRRIGLTAAVLDAVLVLESGQPAQ